MKIVLSVGGMSCSACSTGLEKYLNKQDGVIGASVNLVMAQAIIEYDDSKLGIKDLERFIKNAGFESKGEFKDIDSNDRDDKKMLIIFAILSILMMYVSMGHMISLPILPFMDVDKNPIGYGISLLVITIPFLGYGLDILKSGYKKLIHKNANMDTLVSLGVISSFLYSMYSFVMVCLGNEEYVHSLYFESSAIVIFFVKLGRYIDGRSKNKTKEAIKELVQITPLSALVLENGKEVEKTIDEVNVGDILIAKPGMKIAVDGKVTKGKTHLEEAFITGESVPVKKTVGDNVVAGAINVDGYIEYEAVRIGKDSTISSIVKLVVEATNSKAPIARIADKVSGIFVPSIIVIAILTFIGHLFFSPFSESLIHFVTVLVVACPCALGLATPLAIIVSEGTCASKGILIKGGEVLENLNNIDTVVFDKTGTLTYGNLKISKVYNYSTYSDDELLLYVASLESMSTHPISRAFLAHFENKGVSLLTVDDFASLTGMGLKGVVNGKSIMVGNYKVLESIGIDGKKEEKELSEIGCSIVYVVEDNTIIGLVGVNDIVREDAKNIVTILKNNNIDVVMLTGDNEKMASIIASSIGIEHVIASVLPDGKVDAINKLLNEGKKVMMIGDGINDAPALASATVGVSVSSGTDIAMDSSDIILMNDKLENVELVLSKGKDTIKIIKQNLFWAFFYNIVMIPIAIGLFEGVGVKMSPMVGAGAMMFSSLTVVFNALRLKKWKQ